MCKLYGQIVTTLSIDIMARSEELERERVIIELSSPRVLQFLMSNFTQHSNNSHVLTVDPQYQGYIVGLLSKRPGKVVIIS